MLAKHLLKEEEKKRRDDRVNKKEGGHTQVAHILSKCYL